MSTILVYEVVSCQTLRDTLLITLVQLLFTYAFYSDCPHGPGQPVMGGHPVHFNVEGEQWAPVYDNKNHWVMIGQKYENSATTCMDTWALEGEEPPWGLTNDRPDLKRHIMCCTF